MMNVNIQRILDAKKPSQIKQRFDSLKENYSVVDSIKYLDFIRHQDLKSILENSQYIYSEPRSGADFLLTVLKTNDLTLNELIVQKEGLTKVFDLYKTVESINTLNPEFISTLTECGRLLDSLINNKTDPSYIMKEALYNLHLNFLPQPILESSFNKDMDQIIQNVNSEPQVMDKYQELLRDIKSNKSKVTASHLVGILIRNTLLVIGLTVTLATGSVLLIVSLPMAIVHKLISDKINIKYIDSYIAVINKQIQSIETEKGPSDDNKKKLLNDYQQSLIEAKKVLLDYKIKNLDTTQVKKYLKESLSTSSQIIGYDDDDLDLDDDLEDADEFNTELFIDDNDELGTLEHAFGVGFITLFGDNESQVTIENFNQLMRTSDKYSAILEESTVRKLALKHEEGVKKLVHGARKIGSDLGRTPNITKRTVGHIDTLVSNTINAVKDMDKNERRTRIVEGAFKAKLFKILKNGIALGVVFAVSPAIAVIGLLGAIAIDQKLDRDARQEILHELENELKMCDEKIEDARGDRNKEKKYQLMRIKHKLEHDIGRIKYYLD